jgi:hypothetical protein
MADNDAAHQQTVQQAVQALQQALASVAQARPLPTPANVTEIIIRTGPADAVAAMGTGAATAGPAAVQSAQAPCICIAALIQNLDQLNFATNEEAWFTELVNRNPGTDRTTIIHELLARVIGARAPVGIISQVEPPPENPDEAGRSRTSATSGAPGQAAENSPPEGGRPTRRRPRGQ